MPRNRSSTLDWEQIDLVIFDVDGTLYDQRRLRLAMTLELGQASLRAGNLRIVRTLHAFRRVRERLGTQPADDFMDQQYAWTAEHTGQSPNEVRHIVTHWMEERPLRHLRAARFAGMGALFGALRNAGKTIAIFSDYPARAKLQALDLFADVIVAATDPDVARLKPDPAGLAKILSATGVPAARALMIGDRFDRDWAAARQLQVPALIRSRLPDTRCPTYRRCNDPVFRPLLGSRNTIGALAS